MAGLKETSWKLLTRGVVHAWHHDNFGHMNARWYAHFFDDAAYFIWSIAGLSMDEILSEHGLHTVSANATTDFIQDLSAGSLVEVEGRISRLGNKSMTFEFRLIDFDTRAVHATYRLVEVFFDPKTRTSARIPERLRRTLGRYVVENAG